MPERLVLLDPWFLLLAVAVALAVAVRLGLRPPALSAASLAVSAGRGLPRTLRQRCVHLPLALLALGGVALSVALARPATEVVVEAEEDARDILLVVDISSSMAQTDVGRGQARLDAALERAGEFIAARPGDRIGLMTFNAFAELRCPPTRDHEALRAFVDVVEVTPANAFDDRTAIGVAVAEAARRLDDTPGEPVCLLLTDGANNIGSVLPTEAAKLAADAGVRVHAIAFGRELVRGRGDDARAAREDLEAIAETTGGEYFEAVDDADLESVYRSIDELETVAVADPVIRTEDLFFWPMALGLALVLLGLLVDSLWIRRAP